MDTRRVRRPKYPEMEEQLLEFVSLHEASGGISGFVLWEKANDTIHPEEVSFSWVQKFKNRYNIRFRVAHGESGSVDLDLVEQEKRKLQDLLASYAPQDVFNFDETGLFFRMLPSQSLALGRIRGKKKDKARITVGLCCNMAGTEKMAPVIIHSSLKPRCFRGVNIERVGVHYFANKNAWMTRSVFLEWLHRFNLKMHGRKVLLLVDNAASHESIELSNVRVCFLPPNTTSFLQPLDAGVIKIFNCKYKKMLVRWVIDQLEADGSIGRMDVLTAIVLWTLRYTSTLNGLKTSTSRAHPWRMMSSWTWKRMKMKKKKNAHSLIAKYFSHASSSLSTPFRKAKRLRRLQHSWCMHVRKC